MKEAATHSTREALAALREQASKGHNAHHVVKKALDLVHDLGLAIYWETDPHKKMLFEVDRDAVDEFAGELDSKRRAVKI